MVYRINGKSIVNNNREVTVDSVVITANDRIYAGVTADQTTPLTPGSFQGTISGYTGGGLGNSPPAFNTIDKFPFSSDTNASDVGDLSAVRNPLASQCSPTNGYFSGSGFPPSPSSGTQAEKFPFATDTNATVYTAFSIEVYDKVGQSSTVNGYTSGGNAPIGPPYVRSIIEKFPFATDTVGSSIGNLTQARTGGGGASSSISGYHIGGAPNPPPPAISNIIDKFPFATDSNATDVGDMFQTRRYVATQSSPTHGYASGGQIVPTFVNTIDKFSFASDTNATDVGDMLYVGGYAAGQSSTVSGYISGGSIMPGPTATNQIQKFPFASDTNTTDVGDLTQARQQTSGTQH